MGRTRAISGEWSQNYEQADAARVRFGDPLKRHLKRVRLRDTLFKVGMTAIFLGVTVAVVILALSSMGDLW